MTFPLIFVSRLLFALFTCGSYMQLRYYCINNNSRKILCLHVYQSYVCLIFLFFTYSATTMKKCCSRFLLIPIFYLEKMHPVNYCGSISKTSLIFLTTISCLNCLPLPDAVPVESCIERSGSREKRTFKCVNPAN